jgi:hypothetical protein
MAFCRISSYSSSRRHEFRRQFRLPASFGDNRSRQCRDLADVAALFYSHPIFASVILPIIPVFRNKIRLTLACLSLSSGRIIDTKYQKFEKTGIELPATGLYKFAFKQILHERRSHLLS